MVRDDLTWHNELWRGLPEIVNFNSTNVCDLRCIMCYESVSPGQLTRLLQALQALRTVPG